MKHRSSKTYGHEIGLSASFRQWRAESHCRLLHGYALSMHLEFETDQLDNNNWVVDFGSLKSFKKLLEDTFDHKLLVAEDDPQLETLQALHTAGLADVVVVKEIGCEAFAELVAGGLIAWLAYNGYSPRVRVHHVTVREHGANAASYIVPYPTPEAE